MHQDTEEIVDTKEGLDCEVLQVTMESPAFQAIPERRDLQEIQVQEVWEPIWQAGLMERWQDRQP